MAFCQAIPQHKTQAKKKQQFGMFYMGLPLVMRMGQQNLIAEEGGSQALHPRGMTPKTNN